MTDVSTLTLSEARLKLVDARHELRIAEDYYRTVRLRAELALLDEVGADTKRLGSNAEDRKRAFDAKVDGDEDCLRVQDRVRAAQYAVEELQATIDILLDARRAFDLELRERNISVLENWQSGGGAVIESGSGYAQPSLIP